MHLRVFGGTANDKTFLSTITVGTKVDLFTKAGLGTRTVFIIPFVLKPSETYPEKDDFSGRQRWVISKGSGDWYTIRVLAGVNSGRIFLSTTATGDKASQRPKPHNPDSLIAYNRSCRPYGEGFAGTGYLRL